MAWTPVFLARFRDSDRNHAVHAGRRAVERRQPGMDVAVQLVVQTEIALVLQGGAAGGTLEAVGVQVLVLDAHEHANNQTLAGSANVLARRKSIARRGDRTVDGGANVACDRVGATVVVLLHW